MRFLHLNHRYAPYVGGSERYMQEVSEMLARDGHAVSTITSNASDLEYFWDSRRAVVEAPVRETIGGVDVRRVPVGHFPGSPLVFQAGRRLMGEVSRLPSPAMPLEVLASRLPWMPCLSQTLIKTGPVDMIHAANLGLEGMALAGQRQAARLRVPLLFTPFIHLGTESEATARRYVSMPHQLKLLQSASHVIVMTQIEANFVRSLAVRDHNVTVTGVGIDPSAVTRGNPDRFRRKYGIEGRLVGTAGAVAFEKGSRQSVLAIANLRKRGHAVELVLAGPRLARFDSWFSSLDERTTDGIHVTGFLSPEDKCDMLSAIDALVMPSRTESFGIVFLEGWANKKPVLAARAGAVPELVRDGINGLLVEFGDVSQIEEGILRLLESPVDSHRMGKAGYSVTMQRYTWPSVLDRVRQAYAAALGFELPESAKHA